MRVGLGTTRWAVGIQSGHLDGIGHYTREMFAHLLDSPSGIDLVPMVFGNAGSQVVDNIAVMRLPRYSTSAIWSASSGTGFPGVRSLQNNIDLFHATDHLTPKLTGVPVVATLMDAIPLSHPHWASQHARVLKNWLWKKTGHWADHVVTISEYSKNEISRWFDIAEQNISVTPLGVDARYFERVTDTDAVRYTSNMQLPESFFLFVGTLQPRKNVERIIDAHEQLPPQLRKSFPLLIVGQNGWGSEALVARIKAYGNNGTVRWLQHVDDLAKRLLMQRATALVFPSLLEGFGLPVLEGFASQTPVITSNTSSLPEVSGNAAWMVDPYDVSAITEAMTILAREEDVRRDFIAKGLERARTFTWEACARETEAVYARVLGGR
jgi:glycosyltransferase involved in cell wall biosynthesis